LLQKKRKLKDEEKDNPIVTDPQPISVKPKGNTPKPHLLGENYLKAKSKETSPLMLKDTNENILRSNIVAESQKNNKQNPIHNDEAIIIADDDTSSAKVYGSFESRDVPKRLITAKMVGPNNEVNCKVEWLPRENGVKPADTFISNKLLREKCPNILLDFYESRLRFPSNPAK